jgi:hypothetical protein
MPRQQLFQVHRRGPIIAYIGHTIAQLKGSIRQSRDSGENQGDSHLVYSALTLITLSRATLNAFV